MVEVTDQFVQADLILPPVDRSTCIRVLVQGDTGAPVGDVDFSLLNLSPTGGGSMRTDVLPDTDGAYLVQLGAAEAAVYWATPQKGAKFELRTRHAQLGPKSVELKPGQSEVLISYVPPGTLLATVSGYHGSGHEGKLIVYAEKEGYENHGTSFSGPLEGKVGTDGTQLLERLEPGPYEIVLRSQVGDRGPYARNANELDRVKAQIHPGENRIQLAIPELFTLRVHQADGQVGTPLYLILGDPNSLRPEMKPAALDGNGYATWQDLRAGTYRIRAGSEQMDVDVPSPDIEFQAITPDALRVVISDANGDLAKLGFQAGDLIIGENGEEFTGKPSLGLFANSASQEKKQSTFIVLRQGVRIEITAKAEDVENWTQLGGRFIPAYR